MVTDADDSGLGANLLAGPSTGTSSTPWTCCCAGCTALAAAAQGGATPGSYATTPTDDAYRFVSQAQAPQQDSGGDVAALMAGSKWTSLDSATAKTIIPNTVMSYSPVAGSSPGYMSQYPAEPMALDIAALQYLYGASDLNAGNTWYDLACATFQSGFHALWDAGGNNTFDASRIGHGVVLDLNEGGRSDVGTKVYAGASVGGVTVDITYTATLSIAAGTVIQDAAGTAYDDVLIGNDAINWLSAGAGNDRLDGRGSSDFLIGGLGNDALVGGDGVDTAVYHAGAAGFTIGRTAGGFTVSGGNAGTDSLAGIERVWFSDTPLGQWAADTALNQSHIDLVGLAATGLEYFV